MIVLVSKKTNPLFIEFRTDDSVEDQSVLFIWEDDFYKSILFSDLTHLKSNITYFSSLNKDLSFFRNNITFKVVSIKKYEILFEYKFENLCFLKGDKINYISQNNYSGYGYAGRNYVYQLLKNNYNVYWNVNKFFNDTYEPSSKYENEIFKSLNKDDRNVEFDSCIIHGVPELWNNILNKRNSNSNKLFGSSVWETTKLNQKWINIINDSVIDEIIVPSNFNLEIFKNSGIKKPVNVWRYDIFPIENSKIENIERLADKFRLYKNSKFLKNSEEIKEIFYKKTVYYNISQYSERKNLDQLIKTFCTKFTKNDNVCLFIKTYLQYFTPSQTEYLKYKFYSIIKKFNNPPDLIFCFEELTDLEIQTLHHNFDIYFTLNRGEGFGLCSYTAKKFGNKVICGKFGAEKEFLTGDDILIDYELVPTFNMHLFHNYYDDNDQMWASYNDDDVLKKLEYIPKKNPAYSAG